MASLYAASGAAGLAWQVLWVRMATPIFGAGLEAVAAVTATFLLGLGIGGLLADRLGDRTHGLRAWAGLEAFAGVWGAALPWVLAATGPMVVATLALTGDGPAGLAVRLGVAAVAFGPPAVALGATFPVVARAVGATERPARVAMLYGLNALGAATGALAAGLVLPWWLGHTGSSGLLGAVDLGVAAAALFLAGRIPSRIAAVEPPPGTTPTPPLWLAVAALTGFVGLALEVTWSRLASPMLAARFEGDAAAFAGVLAAVLAGTGLGALVARRLGQSRPGLALAAAQGLLALTGLVVLEPVRGLVLPLADARFVEGLLPLLPALALGASFPVVANAWIGATRSAGRLGALYATNTAGAALGSLAAAFVLVPGLGAQRTAVLLIALSIGVVGVGAWLHTRRIAWILFPALGAMGFAAVVGAAVPPVAGRRVLLPDETLLDAVEGRQTTTVVAERPDGGRLLISGGHRIASASTARLDDHALRARGPVRLARDPRQTLLIGLGTGETARAMLSEPSVQRVVCVELDGNQRTLLRWFGTQAILDDPRFELVIADGRHFLRTDPREWDLIAVDAYGPRTASAAFYTAEFQAEARARLSPHGVLFVKLDPLSFDSPQRVASYLRPAFDAFDWSALVFLERGLFGLVGARSVRDVRTEGLVVAADPTSNRGLLVAARPVTDDHPVAVPLVLHPSAEVLRPYWRQRGPMPWAGAGPDR